MAFLAMFVLFGGLAWGNVSEFRAPEKPGGSAPCTYLPGDTLQVTGEGEILLRRGDSIFLQFPSPPTVTPSNKIDITIEPTNLVSVKVHDTAEVSSVVTFTFGPNPILYKISIVDQVLPGDTNADGIVNMKDILLIAIAMREGIELTSVQTNNRLDYPPKNEQMKCLYPVDDWVDDDLVPRNYQMGSRLVNFKHADCNMDGQINLLDVDYVMAALEPLATESLMIEKLTLLQISATVAPVSLEPSILPEGVFGLNIPYIIQFENVLPNNPPAVLGVVFSRPVNESQGYIVGKSAFKFDPSQVFLFANPKEILWRQKFWNLLGIASPGSPCVNSFDRPLDVFIFRIAGNPVVVGEDYKIGTCTITLLDVLRSSEGAGILPITLNQFITKGVAVVSTNSGIRLASMVCTSDNTVVDPSIFCQKSPKLVIRDGYGDDGNLGPVNILDADNSPDIWVTDTKGRGDIVKNPIPGSDANVNVRVFNYGCTKMTNVKVDVYAAIANTAESWAIDFANQSPNFVGTIFIPEIGPWSSAIGQINWRVPSSNRIPIFTIVAGAYQGASPFVNAPTLGLQNLIHSSTSIAARSVGSLFDKNSNATELSLVLRNAIPNSSNLKLFISQVEGPPDLPIRTFGSLELVTVPACLPTLDLNMVQLSANTYTLQSDESNGSITCDPIFCADTEIRLRYTNSAVNPGGPLHYVFKLTMEAYGTLYNSIYVEIDVPG